MVYWHPVLFHAQHGISIQYTPYYLELNPYWQPEKKHIELCKQADRFSYRSAVETAKKKMMENCNDDM
jgi:hypothetical protein